MKILITGANGMLGRTCVRRLSDSHELVALDLPEFDATKPQMVAEWMEFEHPEVVINCAAYTKVDQAETDQALAYAANAFLPGVLAWACARHDARLIHVSTDYVFAGEADRPYHEFDRPDPRSVYGLSKLAGEEAVRAAGCDHTIVRIAWLYGAGGPSFFHTMRRLGGEDGPPLRVVDDQIGNPTSTDAVVDLFAWLLDHPLPGIVHGTCEGETTWHGFTRAILEATGSSRGLEPCTTAEYPRPAPRPANSRLDKLVLSAAGGPTMPDWRDTLARFVREHPEG